MRAIVFPGQGAQHRGMGEDLFDAFPAQVAAADHILGYSLRELCLADPRQQLALTQYTQPALFVVNALGYLRHAAQATQPPAWFAGHSLGEYNALHAAGVFDFETGLTLVAKRGELMARAKGGGMAAVVGLDEDAVRAVIAAHGLASIEVANFNTPTQFVVAGPRDEILKAEPLFLARGASLYRVLNVSGAFHTSYMGEARREFEAFLAGFAFAEPRIPVISNVHARPYPPGLIKETLAAQIDSSVKWTESVRYLMGKGVTEFVEVGPGQVLTRLIGTIRKEAAPLIVDEAPAVTAPTTPPAAMARITAESLGSRHFKAAYGLKYAYVAGAMYMGLASRELVAAMARAGMLGFFGAGGLEPAAVEEAVAWLKRELNGAAFGVNLLCNAREEAVVEILLRHGVRHIEAAAFIQMTPALVKYRLRGLRRDAAGRVVSDHLILAKLSRPEVAANFLSPAPPAIVKALLARGEVTAEQAECAAHYPMADHLCAEADSAGHTDQETAYALLPTIRRLRDEMARDHGYTNPIAVGAAGGIGTPEAAAAAFVLGADFIVTGSINQCSVESGAAAIVKDMLQQANVQDTDYAPAADMFELGAKVQVLRRGVFFPARANKLYALYRHHNSLDEIDPKTRTQLEQSYFRRSFDEVLEEARAYSGPDEFARADPKQKMAMVFRWYCWATSRYALRGEAERKVDFQIHCGPAMGAFNQWVKDTELESWRNRRVADMGLRLMRGAAEVLNQRYAQFLNYSHES